jgi:Agrobacterium tumefaciens protein Atu4866
MPPPTRPGPRLDATVLGAASLLALALGRTAAEPGRPKTTAPRAAVRDEALAGVWLSADGAVRLALTPDQTYERSITGRRRSSRGTYLIDGTSVLLRDDNGLRTVVTFADGALEMAGYRLVRA